MGRVLKRVPFDFDWPMNKAWAGYTNSAEAEAQECTSCDGSGYSSHANHLRTLWYGNSEFRPEDRGSVPFRPDDPDVIRVAQSILDASPSFCVKTDDSVHREATRLCHLFNKAWCHHLNDDDVQALFEQGRLAEFEACPSAEELNRWSLHGIGHDEINRWICVKSECERLGKPWKCPQCSGKGRTFPSGALEQAAENWQRTEPPAGDGFQLWEIVTEGWPISPVFKEPEDLARYMTENPGDEDADSTFEYWLEFITGWDWQPSAVVPG